METASLVRSLRAELHDPDGVRFTDGIMAEHLTSAGRQLAYMRPDEVSTRDVVESTGGVVHQIPDDGLRLIDVSHNVTSSGDAGSVIHHVDQRVLDRYAPGWRTETPVSSADEYVWDDRRPREFLLVPPVQAGVEVEVIYARDPGEIPVPESPGDWPPIPLIPDSYYSVARHWVLYRMYSLETSQVGKSAANANWQAFYHELGEKVPSQQIVDPRRPQAPIRGSEDE